MMDYNDNIQRVKGACRLPFLSFFRLKPLYKWIFPVLMFLVFQGQGRTHERMSFDLKFGIIKGGEAVMIIRDTTYNGNKAIHFFLKGHTTGITDKLFKVDNIYESTVDAKTYLPYKAVRNVRERKYRYYNEAYFFQENDSLYSEKSGGVKVPHNLSDILTVFFYFAEKKMTGSFEEGNTIVIPTLNGHTVKDIKIKFDGFQNIETKIGMVECYVLSPVVDKGKVLERSDGLKFYISRETKIPILLDMETKAGNLRALLNSYRVNGVEQIQKKAR